MPLEKKVIAVVLVGFVPLSLLSGCITQLDVDLPDLVVHQLSYVLWPEDPSVETSCQVYMNHTPTGLGNVDPESWSFVIHGWVDYESPEKSGRVEKTQKVKLEMEKPETVSLCFDLPVEMHKLTKAEYGFWWSKDDDRRPPLQIEESIALVAA